VARLRFGQPKIRVATPALTGFFSVSQCPVRLLGWRRLMFGWYNANAVGLWSWPLICIYYCA